MKIQNPRKRTVTVSLLVVLLAGVCVLMEGRSSSSVGRKVACVVVYHPVVQVVDSVATIRTKAELIEAAAFYSVDDALKFMESEKIDEVFLIGVYELGTQIPVTATEAAPVQAPKSRRWSKHP